MNDPSHSTVPPSTSAHIHEESDVAIRPLATFLVSLVLGLAGIAVLLAWWFDFLLDSTGSAESGAPIYASAEDSFVDPELQVSPRRDLEIFRERETKMLTATEWINREQGVVRIPIDRAIKLVAERGFPDWPKADVVPPGPQTTSSSPASIPLRAGDTQ